MTSKQMGRQFEEIVAYMDKFPSQWMFFNLGQATIFFSAN